MVSGNKDSAAQAELRLTMLILIISELSNSNVVDWLVIKPVQRKLN
jgi:hypothetical protein